MSRLFDFPASRFAGFVEPSADIDHINRVANSPGMREALRVPDGMDDLSPLLDRGLFLVSEYGFIFFDPGELSCFTFHTAFLPEGRGRHAYKATRAAAEHMFLATDAIELHTFTPFDNPAARPPKTFGFQRWFDGPTGEFYRLHLMDWASKAPGLEAWGEWFHHALEASKKDQDATVQPHDEDASNNRFAGLACGMVAHGKPYKAMGAYNMWARVAGYECARVTSHGPLEFDTGDAVIRFRDNQAEFVSCR